MLSNWANEALLVIEYVKGRIKECCEEEKHE